MVPSEPVEKEVSVHLSKCQDASSSRQGPWQAYPWLYEHKVDKEHDKIIFDVFVGESVAARTLRQAHAFAQRAVIGATVGAVQMGHRVGAFDADGHGVMAAGSQRQSGCGC